MENKNIRICLIGKNKAGRSMVGWELHKKYNFRRIRFDDYLDWFVRRLKRTRKVKPIPFERKLSFYDAWYNIDPTIWVGRVIGLVNDTISRDIVVDDVRYLSEIKELEKLGFIFVRVTVGYLKPIQKGIPSLTNRTGDDAMLYYEWFKPDAENYVKCKYSIHIENKGVAGKAVAELIKNLTEQTF